MTRKAPMGGNEHQERPILKIKAKEPSIGGSIQWGSLNSLRISPPHHAFITHTHTGLSRKWSTRPSLKTLKGPWIFSENEPNDGPHGGFPPLNDSQSLGSPPFVANHSVLLGSWFFYFFFCCNNLCLQLEKKRAQKKGKRIQSHLRARPEKQDYPQNMPVGEQLNDLMTSFHPLATWTSDFFWEQGFLGFSWKSQKWVALFLFLFFSSFTQKRK